MPDGDWNFHVEPIDLEGLSIDASQRLGMVIVQPEYELVPDSEVPFRISEEYREVQKNLIEKAFQIRDSESRERNITIPFILFPEASIPVINPDGLDFIRQKIEQTQKDVIFIGGLEGLSPQEAHELAEKFAPNTHVAKPAFTAGAFVNLCVIAVKAADGPLSWHFQAKLRPSQWEQPRNMANGQRILYFKGLHVAFLCQICFDHIAAQGLESLNSAMFCQLIEKAGPNAATLDFVFVPQCNPDPNHISMKQNTRQLLSYEHRSLHNNMTAVVIINKAARLQEPSEYGRSGFHYRSGRWQVPKSDVGPKGYELNDSDNVASAIFRKRTQAIHVTTVVPPSHNIGNPENPHHPLENPRSYLIGEGCDVAPCSCLPGMTCTVGTFVECDCLPCKLRDALLASLPTEDVKKRWKGSDENQSRLLKEHYEKIRKDLLILKSARARELIYLLLCIHEDNYKNPDSWSDLQFEAIVEFLSALSVFAELQPVNFGTEIQWTASLGENLRVILLDGADKRHTWAEMEAEYRKNFKDKYYRPESRRMPVLLVALRSGGLVQPLIKPCSTDFTDLTVPNRLGDNKSFTKPNPLKFFLCQDTFFEGARQDRIIVEFLRKEMRCLLE